MNTRQRGNTTLIVIILLAGLVFSVTNLVMLTLTIKGKVEVPLAQELYKLCPVCLFYFALAPSVVGILNAIMVWQATRMAHARAMASAPSTAPAPADSASSALQLLTLLQREGRFVDFVQEDIAPYDDAQIGSAVRSIHAGCRKALQEHLQLERVFTAADGEKVTVPSGFDPAAIRITGNVNGAPPFQGTLQHAGWRVASIKLPAAPPDPSIVAPAEVEIA